MAFVRSALKNSSNKVHAIVSSRIQCLTAFKRDLFTVDCICLLFALNDETGIDWDEDRKGWPDLLEVFPNYLPGCKPLSVWIFDVASPGFATNPTEIYGRTA
jgi:hypothetical protein